MPARHVRAGRAGAGVLLALLTACERVVTVSLATEAPRLVVEGRIESPRDGRPDVPRVRLTTTQPYFDARPASPVTSAVVRLSDGVGPPIALTAGPAGDYVGAALTVVPGRVYTLEVTWNGDRYVAVDTAADVVAIDSLYLTPISGTPNDRRAELDFRDAAGRPDAWLWDQWMDGVRVRGADTTSVHRAIGTDEGLDGRIVRGFAPYGDVPVGVGVTVRVRQQGISASVRAFYVALNAQLQNDGSPFGQPSISVVGNVRNVTTPSRRASGYVSVGRYDERTVVRTR